MRHPHRAIVQRETASVSTNYDASTSTWSDLRPQWGTMKPLSGFRSLIGGRDLSLVTHVWESAYDPTDPLKAQDRLSHGSETYAIEWIESVGGRKRKIRAFCRRVDP